MSGTLLSRPIAPLESPHNHHHHHHNHHHHHHHQSRSHSAIASTPRKPQSLDKFKQNDIVYIHKAACKRLPWHEFGPDKTDDSLFIGPFRIIGKVSTQYYKLDLPKGCRIKNCFEERVLKRAETNYHAPPPSSISTKSYPKKAPTGQAYQMDRAHEIVRLVEARRALIRPRYRAQWAGCDPNDTTFITENVLLQLPKERRSQLLRDLEARS